MIGGLCVRVRGRWLLGPIVVCVGVIGGCLGVAIGLSGQFISLLLYDENRSELINRSKSDGLAERIYNRQ